jgi:threonine dehydratase
MISKLRLERAYSRIGNPVKRTEFFENDFLNHHFEAKIFLKCEQNQSIGAFKIRGAANFALQLGLEELSHGLITHSSGNHAQALAYMANKMGVKADVVMPENSNQRKIENAKKWGANIHLCEPTIEAREAMAASIQLNTGGTIIPPFDHEWIIEGQATCAMEMIAQIPDLDYIIAPLGGGGLLSGTALSALHFSPKTKVFGAEPSVGADGFTGLNEGNRRTDIVAKTVADGLRTPVGAVPFEILNTLRIPVWLAPESEIAGWTKTIWEETKMIIETSSAVPFAAMNEKRNQLKGKKIGVIITGGNVDLSAVF